MKCESCDGTGQSANEGQNCFFCNGSGQMCDVCGEACLDGDICDDCLADEAEEE